jgi:hypothetical protein
MDVPDVGIDPGRIEAAAEELHRLGRQSLDTAETVELDWQALRTSYVTAETGTVLGFPHRQVQPRADANKMAVDRIADALEQFARLVRPELETLRWVASAPFSIDVQTLLDSTLANIATREMDCATAIHSVISQWADSRVDGTHALLGALSFVPGPVGMAASAIDALVYLSEGDHPGAALAGLGIVPGGKYLGAAGKLAAHGDEAVRAARAASVATEARALLGEADETIVLGRLSDTAIARAEGRGVVLDPPRWSPELNDEFIRGAIEQRRTIYLASPTTRENLIQTSGQFAGQPTVFARELDMLRAAGYRRVGDYLVPPS